MLLQQTATKEKEKTEAKKISLNLSLLSLLPHLPRLGKSLKSSFSNWMLQLFDAGDSFIFPHPSQQMK